MDGILCELEFGAQLAAQSVESMDEADGKRRAGAHAAAGRQIAVVVQLDAALDVQILERLAHDGVFDLLDGAAGLDLAIDQANAVLEEGRQIAAGEVAVFVDGAGENGAAVNAIPRRIIGAAAEKGDAKRGATDDHP